MTSSSTRQPNRGRNKGAKSTKRAKNAEMPFLSHLGELRKRLIISIVAISLGALVGFFLWDWALEVSTGPYCEALKRHDSTTSCSLYFNNLVAPLTTRLTVATYIGIFIASPIVLWQVWRFVTPGLEKSEKRYAIPFVMCSLLLFALGAWVAWATFPKAVGFMLDIGGDQVQLLLNPGPYLKLILLMMLAFGVVFETPLLLVFLQLVNMITSRQLRNWRRYAVVFNAILAAFLTPSGDPYSMLAMLLPMCVLYEIAIITGRLLKR